jgi:hypothetical protein
MLGSETIVFASLQSGETVTASIRGIRSVQPGAPIRFSVDRRFVHVFDERGVTLSPLRSSLLSAGDFCGLESFSLKNLHWAPEIATVWTRHEK